MLSTPSIYLHHVQSRAYSPNLGTDAIVTNPASKDRRPDSKRWFRCWLRYRSVVMLTAPVFHTDSSPPTVAIFLLIRKL